MSGQPTRVGPLVKVCGLTSVADALACAELGVDYIGLNFHPPSPRYIDPSLAAEIVSALPASCTPVGLFVDRPPEIVAETADRAGLRVVQLHGDEPASHIASLGRLTVFRAFRLGDLAAIGRMIDYLADCRVLGRTPDCILIDGYVVGQHGGTGQSIALDILDQIPSHPRLILAGGLTPANVAERVRRVRPWMVDVASGVESMPGRKDCKLIEAFLKGARGHDSELDRDER